MYVLGIPCLKVSKILSILVITLELNCELNHMLQVCLLHCGSTDVNIFVETVVLEALL